MKFKSSICALALLAMVLGTVSAHANTILSYDFNGLSNGNLDGQDSGAWSIASGANHVLVQAGTGVDTTQVARGSNDAYAVRSSLLPNSVFFTNTDKDIVLDLWVTPANGTSWGWAGVTWNGVPPYTMGIGINEGHAFFQNANGVGNYTGDSLAATDWYEMKLTMDFTPVTGGPTGTLSYRDLTNPAGWITDGTVVNKPLGLTAVGGQYEMTGGIGMRAGGGIMIDNISLSTVPEPSSLVLLAAGLIGLLAYAWRKRR